MHLRLVAADKRAEVNAKARYVADFGHDGGYMQKRFLGGVKSSS